MRRWENFEEEMAIYLSEKYPNNEFGWYGGSDSTVSDIKVNDEFYIEVKMPHAQCGQFVLFPDMPNRIFEYSSDNKAPENKYTRKIINQMERNFEKHLSQKSSDIEINENILADFIIEYYLNKNVRYIITKESDIIILPTEKLKKYFNITANFRPKTSGSGYLPDKWISDFDIGFQKKYASDYNYFRKGKHGYIKTSIDIDDKTYIFGKHNRYFLRKTSKDDVYKIRKLSNTRNSNVIFSINLKKYEQDIQDLNQFVNDLNN